MLRGTRSEYQVDARNELRAVCTHQQPEITDCMALNSREQAQLAHSTLTDINGAHNDDKTGTKHATNVIL